MTCIPIPRGFVCVSDSPVYEVDGYRFEFSRRDGPILVGKRGDPLKNQPGPRSRFWDAFERWERSAHPRGCRQNAAAGNL